MNGQLLLHVVGPDMCGKTHIAKELSRRLNVPYFKASNEHHNFLYGQDKFINDLRYSDFRLADFLAQTGHSAIFDRGYACEKVYSEFFRRGTDHVALEALDTAYASLGAKILVCSRLSFNGITDDLNPSLDCTALTQIADLYRQFTAWTRCQTYRLYVDDENLEREVNEVVDFLKGGSARVL